MLLLNLIQENTLSSGFALAEVLYSIQIQDKLHFQPPIYLVCVDPQSVSVQTETFPSGLVSMCLYDQTGQPRLITPAADCLQGSDELRHVWIPPEWSCQEAVTCTGPIICSRSIPLPAAAHKSFGEMHWTQYGEACTFLEHTRLRMVPESYGSSLKPPWTCSCAKNRFSWVSIVNNNQLHNKAKN